VRDIAPRFEKALDRNALFQMSRSYQRLKSGSFGTSIFIDVSNMPFPASGIYREIFEAISAIDFMTASRTPVS
jgi:hypothetical protein